MPEKQIVDKVCTALLQSSHSAEPTAVSLRKTNAHSMRTFLAAQMALLPDKQMWKARHTIS